MSKETLKLALEALKDSAGHLHPAYKQNEAIKALEEALAKQEHNAFTSNSTKEELLQGWLPRLMEALKYVRDKENAAAEETIYELYVEMSQETLAEKLETFSEITLEDQMSAMAIELLAAQKRVATLENSICQRAFEAKQEQGSTTCNEPVAVKHMMEWVDYLKRKSDYGQHMQIPSEMSARTCWDLAVELEQFINTTPQQRTWVGLTDEQIDDAIWRSHKVESNYAGWVKDQRRIWARAIEAAHGIAPQGSDK